MNLYMQQTASLSFLLAHKYTPLPNGQKSSSLLATSFGTINASAVPYEHFGHAFAQEHLELLHEARTSRPFCCNSMPQLHIFFLLRHSLPLSVVFISSTAKKRKYSYFKLHLLHTCNPFSFQYCFQIFLLKVDYESKPEYFQGLSFIYKIFHRRGI